LAELQAFHIAAGQLDSFCDKKKAASYFEALASYFLGIISSILLAIAIGTVIDLLIKH
jgi:hypothetical protein